MSNPIKRIATSACALAIAAIGAAVPIPGMRSLIGVVAAEAQTANNSYPSDVHADSGFRLPLPKREDLDPATQRSYDRLNLAAGGSLAGLHGPGGILLYSPKLSELNGAVLQYLRGEAGPGGHVR